MRRLLPLLLLALACSHRPAAAPPPAPAPAAPPAPAPARDADADFRALEHRYVVEFLQRNPTESTYLGGSGFDPALAEADGRLRDLSPGALAEELQWVERLQRAFTDARALQSTSLRIDREVALAQLRYLHHLYAERRYQERALDSYVDEPFRGTDASLQGMTRTGEGTLGTAAEWRALARRLRAVPAYLQVAQDQLQTGVTRGNTPDKRMLVRDGLDTPLASAEYLSKTVPALAEARASGPEKEALVQEVQQAGAQAGEAFRTFRAFVAKTFFDAPDRREAGVKPAFAQDHYALGEPEYDWALKHDLGVSETSAQLFEGAQGLIEARQQEMVQLARDIGRSHQWRLPADGFAAVRAVFDRLGQDYPKSDREMVEGYRAAAFRLVDYARKTGLFEVPQDYQLEVVETPEPLRASVSGASYYPAPPFKRTGVGRFYVTPTGNDVEGLKANNVHAMADLSAHEGFPGHDWHYKTLTRERDAFGPLRWLMPGAVEDSSSMWADSMASEGWGLYAEALMAEPAPGAPAGFYTPEERLYMLAGQLYRELRVRVDTGLHTGRLTYAQAVDLFSQVPDFLPGSCTAPRLSAVKRASCKGAEEAIYRYSKWPTQAVTYRLGRDAIRSLRAEARRQAELAGRPFDLQRFHLALMRQGPVPATFVRAQVLRGLAGVQ
ncbi:DUF885 domain-containing protein [Aggregicoccus sp. 17bor-14]|uniref:DUF885 domain-containing protein n=1 Tax=Myxococcaceae TaxID=31 RepID=UPI00129C95C9|nr:MULTISPECIES: DUF885 domain-containing protein [Myxococcaceae]MBF5045961.1 DUF885 domain-containing protein [Simulacricoccus sp. 17bor-14]MRI91693.1 DUF885 domain-containing protein [Aggregicoccus sp. 17bor-14]